MIALIDDSPGLGVERIKESAVKILNNSDISGVTSMIGDSAYASGFGGSGWGISDTDDSMGLENFTVRGTMNVYEMQIASIKATNGAIWVSATGKVSGSVDANGGASYTLYFDHASNNGHGFVAGDIVRHQRWDTTQGEIIKSTITVTAIDGTVIVDFIISP
jgi:hypothetical protein